MFTVTVEFHGATAQPSWKPSKLDMRDIQSWGEALKQKLGAPTSVDAWLALIEGANLGDRLSDPKVMSRARNSF